MAFKLAISTLRWKNPDLEPSLAALKEAGWDGWECRLPLDWLGTPQRVKQICANVGLPMIAYTTGGSPDDREVENVERNKRRMEFAAEMGADVFMYMNGRKPEGRPVTRGDIKAAAEGAEMWADYANVDFPGVRQVLEETNFDRWVTSVPGVPIVSPLEVAPSVVRQRLHI